MDEILKQEELLPPGFACRELESKTYPLSIAGEKKEARVTMRTKVFDQQFESHQLLLPGGPFERWTSF